MAALKNRKLAGTQFGGIGFKGTYTGGDMLKLYAVNILLVVFSLGLAIPVVLNRTLKFNVAHTLMTGALSSTAILQEGQDAGNIGEGVEDEFDSGVDLDFGLI